ncbi:MAG TPA: FeoA family protein [Gemmataceae bacterium]|nr:FeoA family protein [Gemmataceae bacterium]
MLLPLDCLHSGDWAEVAKVTGEPKWVSRLAELGIRPGTLVKILQPGSPCLIEIDGCRLSLRLDYESQILVRPAAIA